jgi:hypothetical protein
MAGGAGGSTERSDVVASTMTERAVALERGRVRRSSAVRHTVGALPVIAS